MLRSTTGRGILAAGTLLLPILLTAPAAADEPAPAQRTAEQIQTAIQQLEKLAQETLQQTGLPGIGIAVVHRDQVVFLRGFGVRAAGRPEPIDADTVFQLASVSKPIASTVLARLVGQGKLDWDDRVIDHDDGFRMDHPFVTRELRLRDLLCHRSGLPDHAGDLLEDLGFDVHQILHRLRLQPPDSSFRTKFAYTNFGYSEACYAAALASGQAWAELAENQLFAPLGMKHTSYRFSHYEQAANRALLHVQLDGKWTAKNTRQPDAQAPAGGASSTLTDLTKWMRLQLAEGKFEGRQIVAADALAETHTPQIVTSFDPTQGRLGSYGLGWNVGIERGGRTFWRHSGAFALGMRTEVSLLPSEELGIAVLCNAAPTGVPEGLTESFFDLVLYGRLERDWVAFANQMFDKQEADERSGETDYGHPPAEPSPPLALSAYAGKYANDYFGPLEVAERDDKLVLRLGPQPQEFELRHWDRDVFIFQPTGEMAGGLSGARFSIAPGGRADSVLIENLNVHGQGTFSRVQPAVCGVQAAIW